MCFTYIFITLSKKYIIDKVINNEFHYTTNKNSIRDNLRPVSSLLGLIS